MPLSATDESDGDGDDELAQDGRGEMGNGVTSDGDAKGDLDDEYHPPGFKSKTVQQGPSPDDEEVDELESSEPTPPPPPVRRSTRRVVRSPGKSFYFTDFSGH